MTFPATIPAGRRHEPLPVRISHLVDRPLHLRDLDGPPVRITHQRSAARSIRPADRDPCRALDRLRGDTASGCTTAELRERVTLARNRATDRFASLNRSTSIRPACNAELEPYEIRRQCTLDRESESTSRKLHSAVCAQRERVRPDSARVPDDRGPGGKHRTPGPPRRGSTSLPTVPSSGAPVILGHDSGTPISPLGGNAGRRHDSCGGSGNTQTPRLLSSSQGEEVRQQGVTGRRQNRFRMELDPPRGQRTVAKRHRGSRRTFEPAERDPTGGRQDRRPANGIGSPAGEQAAPRTDPSHRGE